MLGRDFLDVAVNDSEMRCLNSFLLAEVIYRSTILSRLVIVLLTNDSFKKNLRFWSDLYYILMIDA